MTSTDRPSHHPETPARLGFDLVLALGVAAIILLGLWLWRPWNTQPSVQKRVAWTTSHIHGTPEPPPPYEIHRLFPKLASFNNPLDIDFMPDSGRVVVVEQWGKIFTFPNKPDVEKADLLVDLKQIEQDVKKIPGCNGVNCNYDIAFDPKFKENRYVYICYVLDFGPKPHETGSRVSRFKVNDTDPPTIDPGSEQIILDWPVGGHNGGCLKFGRDGDLYISTGDQSDPNPPDMFNVGQKVSDLRAKILRIDVDHPSGDKPYSIPADNPFVKTPGARGEVWCYGLRNPWRMSFDSATGRLWIGDVGWELWESIICAVPGGNYGWSIMEGPNPVHPDGQKGPTPILPPQLALNHSEAASLTGGYVYRGKKFPDLVGHYICGDWETRRLWDAALDGEDKLKPHRTLAETDQRIVAFGEDADRELYIADYEGGGIYTLAKNNAAEGKSDFPTKLSDTGLFTSVPDQTPAPGVVAYSINTPQWLDGAVADRFVAIPGDGKITWKSDEPKRVFPKDTVLARTISLPMTAGDLGSRRKIETQILHFDGKKWHAYSYRWNDQQTDAELIKPEGEDQTFTINDRAFPEGTRKQTWHYSSRAQCMTCHNSWSDYVLGFTDAELDRSERFSNGATGNQLAALRQTGLLPEPYRPKPPNNDAAPQYRLVDPYDPSETLTDRARSYLQVNCSHCHRMGGGGSALFDVRRELSLKETHLLAPAMLGSFGIPDARIICPGDPSRSVMLYRVSKTGLGRMPHIGSDRVDDRWVALLSQWITEVGMTANEPVEGAATVDARAKQQSALRTLQSDSSSDEQIDQATDQLIGSTSGALALLTGLENGLVSDNARQEAINRAAVSQQPTVHDLFERFPVIREAQPEGQPKVARATGPLPKLGTNIDPAKLLALAGDADKGKEVFTLAGCAQCHFAGDVQVRDFGPNLSHIGTKYDKTALLDNILHPDKSIAEGFMTYLVQKTNGDVTTAFVLSQNDKEVVIKDQTTANVIHLPRSEVRRLKVQMIGDEGAKHPMSPMPEGLLSNLDAQQAADLLEFLHSLK